MRLLRQQRQTGQRFAFAGVAEEGIQRFLHLLQILPDLLRHMHQHVALGFALAGGCHDAGRHFAAFDQGIQTSLLALRAHRKIGVQEVFLIDGILHEQQRGSDFQIHLLVRLAVAPGSGKGRRRQFIQQGHQAAVFEHLRLRLHAPQLALELLQLSGIAFHVGMPAVACSPQAGLQGIQHRAHARQRFGVQHAAARQVAVETEGRANFRSAAIQALAFGHEEQRIAQQAFGDLRRAFHQPAHLQVDASEQLLDVEIGFNAARNQTIDKADAGPPEGL